MIFFRNTSRSPPGADESEAGKFRKNIILKYHRIKKARRHECPRDKKLKGRFCRPDQPDWKSTNLFYTQIDVSKDCQNRETSSQDSTD